MQTPILLTKFQAPVMKDTLIHRLALTKKFNLYDQYKVTLVHSGPGYGKSTAIANWLTSQNKGYGWYTASAQEGQLARFLIHMTAAVQQHYPKFGVHLIEYITSESVRRIEEEADYLSTLWMNELHQIKEPFIFVLDDFHAVENVRAIEEWMLFLLENLPSHVHFVLSSRIRPNWDVFTKLLVHGDMLEISEQDLSFKREEIDVLFTDNYQLNLTDLELEQMIERTEGWIIALQMIWQEMKLTGKTSVSKWQDQTKEELFRYLAFEVFQKQSEDTKEFLLTTCILDDLHIHQIKEIFKMDEVEHYLKRLMQQNLFIHQTGQGQYRYHALFQDFLIKQLRKQPNLFVKRQAALAQYYLSQAEYDRSLHCFLEIEDIHSVGYVLETFGLEILANGKMESLMDVIDKLTFAIKQKYPLIHYLEGEIHRYLCHYEKALTFYDLLIEQAQNQEKKLLESLGQEGKAKIYLDTIQPAKAVQYLSKAISLMEGNEMNETRILHLYSLMAENLVNLGKAQEAEIWIRKCKQVNEKFSKVELEARQYLRTGKLDEAQWLLEKEKSFEFNDSHLSQFHRETDLILSIVYAYKGEADLAKVYAQKGILKGTHRRSPFAEACGWIRMGHAVQIQRRYDSTMAINCYQTALQLMEDINVSRGKSEAYMGLCVLYAKTGEYEEAIQMGQMALKEPKRVKDVWLSAYIFLSLGMAYFYKGEPEQADGYWRKSEKSFEECQCQFGQAITCYWLSRLAFHEQDFASLAEVSERLSITMKHYAFFYQRLTLFGPKDVQEVFPMLIEMGQQNRGMTQELLMKLGIDNLTYHPGYTLKVQSFGEFKLWLGHRQVLANDWKREKAKELFQLFLTNYGQLVEKETIMLELFGGNTLDSANRDFKVALNALNKVLDPERKPRVSPFFIIRQGSRYGLNVQAGIDLDKYHFQKLVRCGLAEKEQKRAQDLLERGLALYIGDYLPERTFNDWSLNEKNELKELYLLGAEKLAYLMAIQEDYDRSITLCEKMIGLDNCYEEAFRILMYAYYQKNNRAYALRMYEKCKINLQDRLGIKPMESLIELVEKMKNEQVVTL